MTVFYPILDKLFSGVDLRFKQDTFDLVGMQLIHICHITKNVNYLGDNYI